MGIDPKLAANIRRLYLDDRFSMVAIAKKTGCTVYAVTLLIKFKRWDAERVELKRRELCARMEPADEVETTQRAIASAKPAAPVRAAATEGDLVQRLYNAIDETLAQIEIPSGTKVKSGGEYDRKTRAISSMVRSLEKVLEIKVKQAQANDQSGGVAAEKVRADAEQLRRDIAERLERLQRKRKSQSPSR